MILRSAVWVFLLMNLGMPQGHAFTDEVGASPERVWQSVKDVFGNDGIHKEDWESRKITTSWIHDEVRRSRGFFRGVLKQSVKRRYRFDISVTKGETATELQLKVKVEEKARATSPSIPWNQVKPESEDYILEREFFHKILKSLSVQLALAQDGSETPVSPYSEA